MMLFALAWRVANGTEATMRIENGSCGAALCLILACGAAACSSDAGRDAANGSAGATANGGGAGAANGGSSGASTSGGAGGAPAGPQQRTVGYLPSYRGSLNTWATTLDFSLVSYVDVCFGTVDASGNVGYPDAALGAFVTAAHAKGSKVCLALGGATTINDLGALGVQIAPANRAAFVGKIVSYAMTTGLDCIDVDFEGNGVNQDYEGFVTALGPALKAQGKQMSAALASWFGDKVTSPALQAFDFVNVMAYDLHNPGGTTPPVQSSSMEDSKKEIDYWVGRGLAKEKAVFGVPFYGYRWKPGATTGEAVVYAELLSTYGAAAASDQISKDGTTIYLNSKATIISKAQAARQYGGIMVWELGQDAAGESSLLRAINSAP
jgi:GH18 family chitinase